MGTWGTGIYSNDIAEDIRDMCKDIFSFVDVKEGNSIILREYKEIIESDIVDDEYASFWYALADWQWKHGILNDEIRAKTMELLENYAGISDWEESASKADVKKRIAVMDKLKIQLTSPMPPVKLTKGKLLKPKHRVGDVLIFQTCLSDEIKFGYDWWEIKEVYKRYIFKKNMGSDNIDVLHPSFDAYNQYMAILCVGTEKKQHSPYLPNLYDEYSVYAYYDYISKDKPSLIDLQKCGFLPQIRMDMKDFNRHITEDIGWTYRFYLSLESFQLLKDSGIKYLEKIHTEEEIERFYSLINKKGYSSEIQDVFNVRDAFYDCWGEKMYMKQVGMKTDNLLNEDIINPEFLPLDKIDEAYRKMSGKW